MRKMKKLAGLLLAMVMVLTLGTSVYADDATYTITITYSESGHTYEAYQIFIGDLAEEYLLYTGDEDLNAETRLYTCAYDSDAGTYTYTDVMAVSGYSGNFTTTTDGTVTTTGYYYVSRTKLSNIQWGSGVNSSELIGALKEASSNEESSLYGKFPEKDDDENEIEYTAAMIAEIVATFNTEQAEEFAQIVSENLSSTVAGTSNEESETNSDGDYVYKIQNLPAGYYLVKDKDNSVTTDGDSYTDIILEVVTNVAVAAKADTVTLDKEVGEGTTDSTYETTAEYDIGDDVPFSLIATLPSNYASYDKYALTFHDTLSDGLNFNNNITVEVYNVATGLTEGATLATETYYELQEGGMVLTSDTTVDLAKTYYTKTVVSSSCYSVDSNCYHEVSITAFENGVTYYTYDDSSDAYTKVADNYSSEQTYYVKCTFAVKISDTNSLVDESGDAVSVSSSSVIVVTYTAKLTDEAATIEDNTAYLEYSNNPNDDSSTGNTPEDVTTVITFTLDIDKVDENSDPLEGAGFTLYKAEVTETNPEDFANGEFYYLVNGVLTKATSYNEETTYYKYIAVGDEVFAGYQEANTASGFTDGVTYYTYDETNEVYIEVDTSTTTTPQEGKTYYTKNKFTFEGLAVGYYKLVETTTPAGYNTMDDLYFQVAAETKETDEVGSVKKNTLKILDENGNEITEILVDETKLSISTDIVNNAGSTLPSTGGIGTTIFYILGTLMVFGAAVVLITRRRMSSAE